MLVKTFSSVDWMALALSEATFYVDNFVLFYSTAVVANRNDIAN